MIQMQLDYLKDEKNIFTIVEKAKEILDKRKRLYERYRRKVPQEIQVPLEYYIANVATGYFGGKAPTYTIKQETEEKKKNIIKKLFDKIIGKDADDKEFQVLFDYIRDYNDDPAFFYEIVFDYMTTGACYWTTYETTENEIVYAKLSSLQTIAIYDYSTPVQKIAGLRVWQETDADGFECNMVEVTMADERRFYKNDRKQPKDYKEIAEKREDIKWDLVPFNAVENPDDLAIYEPVITLIDAYETIIKNNKHLFEYNDDAKLKITGFTPDNPLTIEDENGNIVKNPNRTKEDEMILEAPTFYTPDNTGDISWLIKDINDTASENHKKTLIELILMISMIPNVSEISTTEKTATEIERSFFTLEQVLTRADKLFKKELLAMWENIVARINLKKHTKFDFREIQIDLQRNLPIDKASEVTTILQMKDLLSDETLLRMLPYDLDVESELAKKQEEAEMNFNNNMEKIQNVNNTPTNEEETDNADNVEETESSRE